MNEYTQAVSESVHKLVNAVTNDIIASGRVQWELQGFWTQMNTQVWGQFGIGLWIINKDALKLERETGIEPATSSLGSWRSTAELLPLAEKPIKV
jgi:hypothetical protein